MCTLTRFVLPTHVFFYFECKAVLLPVYSEYCHEVAWSKSGVRFLSSVECQYIIVHVKKCGEQRQGQDGWNPQASSDERGPAALRA